MTMTTTVHSYVSFEPDPDEQGRCLHLELAFDLELDYEGADPSVGIMSGGFTPADAEIIEVAAYYSEGPDDLLEWQSSSVHEARVAWALIVGSMPAKWLEALEKAVEKAHEETASETCEHDVFDYDGPEYDKYAYDD
jgi:hypothetical protein